MKASAGRFALASPPQDGVSCVHFAPTSNLLLASSWDSTLRLYDASLDLQRARFQAGSSPALCCAFLDDAKGLSGGLDGQLRLFDLAREEVGAQLGAHSAAIRAVGCGAQLAVTGSWDGTVKAWDPRSGNDGRAAASVAMPGKVYALSVRDQMVVASSAGQAVWLFDLRRLAEPLARRGSSLKYQTRCVALSPDASSFAMGSIEGRVAVEYVSDEAEAQSRKYAFKCHRRGDVIFPVNAIAFHPGHGTFATGGCDGGVSVWDGANKKRLASLEPFPTSVASLSFSHDGSLLAVASSYTFEQGDIEHPADEIYIHTVSPQEVRPKARKPKA